jgi:hypothetical protein
LLLAQKYWSAESAAAEEYNDMFKEAMALDAYVVELTKAVSTPTASQLQPHVMRIMAFIESYGKKAAWRKTLRPKCTSMFDKLTVSLTSHLLHAFVDDSNLQVRVVVIKATLVGLKATDAIKAHIRTADHLLVKWESQGVASSLDKRLAVILDASACTSARLELVTKALMVMPNSADHVVIELGRLFDLGCEAVGDAVSSNTEECGVLLGSFIDFFGQCGRLRVQTEKICGCRNMAPSHLFFS